MSANIFFEVDGTVSGLHAECLTVGSASLCGTRDHPSKESAGKHLIFQMTSVLIDVINVAAAEYVCCSLLC